MTRILTSSNDFIIMLSEKFKCNHDWERKNMLFSYFITCSFLCNKSVRLFLCDSDAILQWISSCTCKNTLKNCCIVLLHYHVKYH